LEGLIHLARLTTKKTLGGRLGERHPRQKLHSDKRQTAAVKSEGNDRKRHFTKKEGITSVSKSSTKARRRETTGQVFVNRMKMGGGGKRTGQPRITAHKKV